MTRYSITIKKVFLLELMFTFSFVASVNAQKPADNLHGIVTDEFGTPLVGITVSDENGIIGTTTNTNGEYTLVNSEIRQLVFSYAGYITQKVTINENKQLNVQLKWDVHKRSEIVNLGYTSQLRGNISGSVATVSGAELEKSPVANLSQTFAGRLAGLFAEETSSELSKANTKLYIRGVSGMRLNSPLVLLDGILVSYLSNQTLEYISANEIESVTILKDASTQALYGIQGANGLMVVTTKRGMKGKSQVKVTFDQSMQQVTTKPTFYSSADYAEMRNQAAFNDGHGLNYLFSDEQIAKFRADDDSLYPSNDWYDKYMKDFASMQRVGVSATGGNDKVQYFSNINFMHQGGQFKVAENDKYNPEANNTWVNFRTNVDMSLNKYLKSYIRLAANIKRERTAGSSNSTIYSSLFQMPPTAYGPLTPTVTDAATGIVITPGQVVTTQRVASPTYGMLNRSGYIRNTVTNITSQFGFDLDMSFLTKGLNFNGMMAYQTNFEGNLSTTHNYERWVRTSDLDTLLFTKKGTDTNTPLTYGKSRSFYYHLSYNLELNYKRGFGKHQVGAMAYMFYQNLTKEDLSSPELLPYKRLSTGTEGSYGYDNRYLLKFDVGYSGSEQYARAHRFTLTPAVSGAWVISNEAFMKVKDWLSNLKLRASYGKTANDQCGNPRFVYLDNMTNPGGGYLGYLGSTINETQIGNPDMKAEVSVKQNYGIDLGLFNTLSVSIDIFKEHLDNAVVPSYTSIPSYQGIPLNYYPSKNMGIYENKGYEITVGYDKKINHDLDISAEGMICYNKNTVFFYNESVKSKDYAYKKWTEGYSLGQTFGYLVDKSNGNGFFNTQVELNSAPDYGQIGIPRLGDLKYLDMNHDNIIDERDKAPIGDGYLPRITYAFRGDITWKSFELSFLFQGVGKWTEVYSGAGVWETDYDGVFGALHKNAWTQERYNNGGKITSPALSLTRSVNHQTSNYYQYDRSYLRLKNVELAYTLPSSLLQSLSVDKVRFVLSGQNLVTWDNMKSDDFGPEGTYSSFPVYRVFNLGVNVVF